MGATVIGDSLKNDSTLQMLYMPKNIIGNVGAIAIANALAKNSVLKRLYLDNNQISDPGLKAFRNVLQNKNKTLNTIVLSFNNFGATETTNWGVFVRRDKRTPRLKYLI